MARGKLGHRTEANGAQTELSEGMQQVSENQPLRPCFVAGRNQAGGARHDKKSRREQNEAKRELCGQRWIERAASQFYPGGRHHRRETNNENATERLEPACRDGIAEKKTLRVSFGKKIE